MNTLTWAADRLIHRHERRVDVRLRVHRAFLISHPAQPECWFLNVLNASPEREVQVTHVWIEAPTGHVGVLTKPLPATIRPQQQWETFLAVSDVPGIDVATLARAVLSDGTTIESEARVGVPPSGYVPG